MTERIIRNDESKLEEDYAGFTAGEKGREGQNQKEHPGELNV
jgi:hypothetical protein